jgi:hypothetical protein
MFIHLLIYVYILLNKSNRSAVGKRFCQMSALSEREYFTDIFLSHGITLSEIRSMSDLEFSATLNGFLDSPDSSTSTFALNDSAEFGGSDEALVLAINASLNDRSVGKADGPPPPRPNPRPTPLPKPKAKSKRGPETFTESGRERAGNLPKLARMRAERLRIERQLLEAASLRRAGVRQQTGMRVYPNPSAQREVNAMAVGNPRVVQERPNGDRGREELETMTGPLESGDFNSAMSTESHGPLGELQLLRRSQDDEYVETVEEAQRREAEEDRMRRESEEAKGRIAEEMERKASEVEEMARAMAPEPMQGVAIAASLVGGERVVRRFRPSDQGKWVYAWVAWKSTGKGRVLAFDDFELKTTVGNAKLECDRTLHEQGITGRVLFAVSLL